MALDQIKYYYSMILNHSFIFAINDPLICLVSMSSMEMYEWCKMHDLYFDVKTNKFMITLRFPDEELKALFYLKFHETVIQNPILIDWDRGDLSYD